MNTTLKTVLVLACAAALAAVGHLNVRASGVTCTAHLGGINAGKKAVPVLTVFNAQDVLDPVDVDVVVRDEDGATIVRVDDALTLGSFESGSVDLWKEIAGDLPRGVKPYQGLIGITLESDAADFDPDQILVHVTQYIGSRKRPKGALLFTGRFRDEAP